MSLRGTTSTRITYFDDNSSSEQLDNHHLPDTQQNELLERFERRTQSAEQVTGIEKYIPDVHANHAWLHKVVDRIRSSVIPDEYEPNMTTEYLSERSAETAISFFQNYADLLPTEPHIYSSLKGDLVAEFESEVSNMTSILNDEHTILFGFNVNDPDEPIHETIHRGNNRFREKLMSFTSRLKNT